MPWRSALIIASVALGGVLSAQPCTTELAPYTENFDATLTTPNCWTNTATGTTLWLFSASGGTGPGYGVAGAVDHTSGTGNFTWFDGSYSTSIPTLTSPQIDITPLTTPIVSLWVLSNNTNDAAQNTLKVQAYDGTGWVDLTSYAQNDPAWVNVTATVPASIPSPAQFRLTIEASAVGSDFYNDILVDDFQVIEAPTCFPPTNVTVSNVSTAGADLSWTDNTSGSYNYEVRTSGAPGSGPAGLAFNGTVASGTPAINVAPLTAATTYTLYVQGSCSGGTDLSAWTNGLNFTPGMVQVGDGASTNTYFPIYTCYTYNYSQQIYLASELAGSGQYITKIAFKYMSGGTTFANWDDWTVYMGNTTQTEFSTTTSWIPATSLQACFTGTVTPVAGQWMEINLDTPFLWDGTSNVVVAVDENTAAYSCTAAWQSYAAAGTNRGILYYSDPTNPDPTNPPSANVRNSNLAQIRFFAGDLPACLPPTSLQANNVLASSADFSWTASGSDPANGYQWEVRTTGEPGSGPAGLADSGTVPAGTTTASSALLNPETDYSVYARSDCDAAGLGPWIGPVSFTTTCVETGLPYTEDFEEVTTPAIPQCMDIQTIAGSPWTSYAAPAGMTGTVASVANSTIAQDTWLFTQGLALPASSIRLMFKYKNISTAYTASMGAYLGTSPDAASMTTLLSDLPTIDDATVHTDTAEFTPGTAGVYYIGFKCYSAASQNRLYLDDIIVMLTPSCEEPTGLSVDNITATDADFSWTASTSDPANGYLWEVRSSGEPGSGPTGLADSGTTPAGVTTASTTALSPSTTYYLYVSSDCGGGDIGPWAASASFFTLCTSEIAPYTENFDAGLVTPDCWTNTATGTTEWKFTTSGGTGPGYGVTGAVDHTTGTGNFTWFDGTYSTSIPTLTSPLIDITPLTQPMVSLWVLSNNTNDAAQNTLKVQVYDGASWVDLISYAQNDPAWVNIYAAVPVGTPSPAQFRLTIEPSTVGSDFYNDILVDDFQVVETPSCLPPTDLDVTNITANSADLTWTASPSAPANGYQWEVRSSGDPGSGPTGLADSGTTPAGVTTASTTALSPITSYLLYVRSDCGGDLGPWVNSTSFTTQCTSEIAPYTENFDAGLVTPDCWTNTATGTTLWLFTASGGTGPGYGLAGSVDHTSGTGNFTWFDGSYSTSIPTLTSPLIDITPLTQAMVSLWVLSNNTNDAAQNTLVVQAYDGTNWVDLITYAQNDPAWVNLYVGVPASIPSPAQFRLTIIPSTVGSAFYNDILVDDFQVIEAPTCLPPTNVVTSNVTYTSADLSWDASVSDPADGYQWEVRTSGDPGSGATGLVDNGSTAAGVTTASTAALTSDTEYMIYVRSVCGAGDTSAWAGPVNLHTGYCTPAGNNVNYYINDFSTTGGGVNITNSGTGYATNGYADFSSQIVSQTAGGTVNFNAIFGSGSNTFHFRIWVDWNNNFSFNDPGELMFDGTTYETSYTDSFTVPTGTPDGDYRMRIRNTYTGTPMPCGTSNGETEDYTFTVGPPPSCMAPTALTSSNMTLTSADLSWTASATPPSNGYQWEVRTSGMGGSGATGLVDNGTTAAGVVTASTSLLTANTTYTLYVRSDCGAGDLSTWAASSSFTTGYCAPSGTNSAYYLDSFSTTGGTTNISNLASGFSPGGYGDFTSQSLTTTAGSTINFTATWPSGQTYTFNIWVDLNNDFDFDDAGELLYTTGSGYVPTPLNNTFTVPAGTADGSYRMRVRDSYIGVPTSCGSTTYGEAEDYTLVVGTPPVDCEGVVNGPALPGTACVDANGAAGVWDDNCVCIPDAIVDCEGVSGGPALPGTPCYDTPNGWGGIWSDACVCIENVGVGEVDGANSFAIYPNPASTILYITTANNAPVHVKVYDMVGTLVLEKDMVHQLDITKLATGSYTLVATDGKGGNQQHARFMKQ